MNFKKEKIAAIIKKLRRPEYVGVFDDLVAFTGLTPESVCRHILMSSPKSRKELKFVAPKGPAEMELFYRCSREYLFLSAFRCVSQLLIDAYKDGLAKGPVLDFGAGMGNDSTWLFRQGCEVSYLEIGIIQREFVRFRVWRNGFDDRFKILVPYVEGKYDPTGCVEREYGTLLMRDVLEHIPGYPSVVKRLVAHLRPGGTIVEHTPWNVRNKDDTWKTHNAMHHEESVPLKKLFNGLGLTAVRNGVWRMRG